MRIKLLNNRIFFMSFLFIIAFSSCKKEKIDFQSDARKDRLTGDTSILVGEWSWIYSDHEYGWCDNEQLYETLTPDSEGISFSVKYSENGFVQFFRDQKLISEHKMVFRDFEHDSPVCETAEGSKYFIYLDGSGTMSGCIDYDTLMRCSFTGFLFSEPSGCGYYNNFFVRE